MEPTPERYRASGLALRLPVPAGHVSLHEAVDLVGQKLPGIKWRPFATADEPAREGMVFSDPSGVFKKIAEACEDGRVIAAYRSNWDGGAAELDKRVWQLPRVASYFITGTIDQDLPLLDERGRHHPDGPTARCRCEIFIRRNSLDDFVAGLEPAVTHGDGTSPRRGAPEILDWEEIRLFSFKQLDDKGDFALEKNRVKGWRTSADLYRLIGDHMGDECPSLSSLKERVPDFVEEWRHLQASN